MGALSFTINAMQSGQIAELEKEIEQLKEEMLTARAWIEYLNAEVKELRNANSERS